jgi:hypothetical protein
MPIVCSSDADVISRMMSEICFELLFIPSMVDTTCATT